MELKTIIKIIEDTIPLHIAESYDNCGLLVGKLTNKVSKIFLCLECTEEVIRDAIDKKAELIVSHHPLIFSPIKSLSYTTATNKMLIRLIENNIALYCIHTNLDNLLNGVNKLNADKIGLTNTNILLPKANIIRKLITFAPCKYSENIQQALFKAGAGKLGNYENCSFVSKGVGTFRPLQGSNPFIGIENKVSKSDEVKIEAIYPYWLEKKILQALMASHPYEEVAFDILSLNNSNQLVGSGIVGILPRDLNTKEFIDKIKKIFSCTVIKHTALIKDKVKRIAFCGGSGSFLIESAIKARADVFVTSDIKYHDFFKADGKIILLDIGHYESEQYVPSLINNILSVKMPKLEFFISDINTNPVFYY